MKKRMILAACLLLAVTPCAACGGESSEGTVVGQAKQKLNQADCNDIARRAAAAASTALSDLAAGDADVTALSGDQETSYTEFCGASAGDSGLSMRLYAAMKTYDTDLEKSDFVRMRLRIEGGVCTAAAVSFSDASAQMYGTYPKSLAAGVSEQPADITAALNYAAS